MHRSKRKRNLIIFSLVGVLLCMVAGYAAFQTQLKVTGSSTVTSNWDIEITNVTAGTPTGSAENAVAPSFDKLWASMEANLYDKGDAMEYDVTIENKGTLDAKLNDIITNLDNSNNEAVLITFSGYTKGEVLKAKTSKVVHVKIEYNPEYEGGETSSEVEINFDYGQNNNEENNPDSQYLLTYDYSTNGGTSVELTEELIASGSNVDLSNSATKEGWNFVGWNTDKDAQIGLENYQMPASNTTLYAIYSKTLKVTYEKGENIDSIGKNEDSCNIYNNQTSCEVTLPEITVSDDSVTVGWYNGEDKIGEPNDKYTITNDITLRAEAQFEPIIQSWSSIASTDFHAEEYRTNIITATFLDNKEVPEGATSWDVSAEKNGSVMAWVIPDETDSAKYHLYIGGDGGVIANQYSSYLFRNFTNLQTITFGDNFDTSKVTSMNRMFQSCNKLTTLDVSQWDTSNVTDMISMFENCRSLTTLDVSNWNTSNVIRMDSMFYSCSSLTTLDVSNWNISNVTNMYSMFSYCSSLTTLDVSKWDTSNVTNMRGMFSNCSSLTTLDVSNWDTSNVTNMQSMFYNCSSLTTLDISKFDTSNVTYMSFMFSYCSSLTTLDVSKWNTSNVTNMGNMFEGCSSLTTIDLSNWNTSNVTTMQQMFNYCSSLITLDVSKWNTSSVTNMQSMFSYCSSLTKLVLCSFDTNKVTDMDYMFEDSSNLKSIYVGSNWTTENATTTDMFTGSGVSEVTQSNNCEYDAEEMSLEISTTSTTNSITVVATAYADSGIAKYEYSKDGGKAWEESTNNTYTFTGLTTGTAYDIKVRVTSNVGKTLEKGTNVDITNNVVTTGDGLYEDEYEDGRYVYKGANPNNYIWFNDEMWRIIAKEIDGTYKIMKNESIGNMAWDTTGGVYGNNNWDRPADLKTYLNDTYLATITTNADKIVSHTWGIGKIIDNNSDLAGQIADENEITWAGEIGLMSASDYLKANTNTEQCGNMNINNTNKTVCIQTNWIFKIIPEYGSLWTISSNEEDTRNVFSISGNMSNSGWINMDFAYGNGNGVSPTTYLNSNVTLSGIGSYDDPYQINKISTSTLETPIFMETGTYGKTVTITYPSGCGDSLTCTYQKDNGEVVNVSNNTVDVEFSVDGNIVATVSDGTNTVSSSSYAVDVTNASDQLEAKVVTTGQGIYDDIYEENHYVYKGANPDNYIRFNNELWRIISTEQDDTIKIIRNESLGEMVYDEPGSRNSTTNTGTYCISDNGCNAYGITNNFNGLGTVLKDSTLNTYLNGKFYNGLTSDAKLYIIDHDFPNYGPGGNGVIGGDKTYIDKAVESERQVIWHGNIGLMNLTDFLRGTLDSACDSVYSGWQISGYPCHNDNYLYKDGELITTMTTWTYGLENEVWTVNTNYNNGGICSGGTDCGWVYLEQSIYPVLYLRNTIYLTGSGTESSPYIIHDILS